jgi:hypothetical protein
MAPLPARPAPAKLLLGLTTTLLALVAGCGAPAAVSGRPEQQSWSAPAGVADRAHIVAVYQSHCGNCHRPVPPGSEPHDRLQVELIRHRKRARLTEQEWAGLDAFLVQR